MTKRGKKALSHIEVILSFTIFFLFLTFLFIIFNPIKRSTASSSLIDNVEYAVKNYISAEVELTSIITDSEIGADCIQVSGISNKVIIKKTSNRYFIIFSSNDFPVKDLSSCASVSYQKGITRTEKIILKSKIEKLEGEYYTDYGKLKQDMALPSNSNFNVEFNITTESKLITAGRFLPSGTSIFARELPILVMQEDGNLVEGFMNLRVW